MPRGFSPHFLILAPVACAVCPPGDPDCQLVPAESEEVNPDPGVGDVALPGSPLVALAVIPMPLPRQADPSLLPGPASGPPTLPGIDIPLRYQQAGDVSCGMQALRIALDGLEGAAPTSAALPGFLQGSGVAYDFGTGVEGLAYAAQSTGYRGSHAFHGASLEDLASQLTAGSAVVVSPGANSEGAPGQFVTVTGISPDGKWVACNDPTFDRQVLSIEELRRLWGLQGSSDAAVFDSYKMLTTNGGGTDSIDAGADGGNRHDYWHETIQSVTDPGGIFSTYAADGDSHPTLAGNLKATVEFVLLLCIFCNQWRAAYPSDPSQTSAPDLLAVS
jgi:hypothetical protein